DNSARANCQISEIAVNRTGAAACTLSCGSRYQGDARWQHVVNVDIRCVCRSIVGRRNSIGQINTRLSRIRRGGFRNRKVGARWTDYVECELLRMDVSARLSANTNALISDWSG